MPIQPPPASGDITADVAVEIAQITSVSKAGLTQRHSSRLAHAGSDGLVTQAPAWPLDL